MSGTTTPITLGEMDLPQLDLRGAEFTADPIGVLGRTLAASPLARSKRGIEVLSYDLIAAILADDAFDTPDPHHYEQLGAGQATLRFVEDGLLSTMDRSRHDPIRRLLMRAFTFKRIDLQRELMREVAGTMIDDWIDDGRCDLVGQLTESYPITVMCRMIGVPIADIPRFAAAAHELHLLGTVPMAPGFPRIEAALEDLEDYVGGLLDQRRAEPQDDFISALIQAEDEDEAITRSELIGNLVNLIFAGMGTTTKQIASAVADFVEHGVWEQLHEQPDLRASAVEEALRFTPVTQFIVRIPLEDAVVGDIAIPVRERLILNLLAASRDPEKFEDPDRFDITRGDSRSRLPFGWGVHRCLGHALARGLIEEAISLLAARITDVRIVDRVPDGHPSAMLGGPLSMQIEFRRR